MSLAASFSASPASASSSTTSSSTSSTTSTTAPASPPSVNLDGHGWGHGIGMGQWGALGYALGGEAYSWMVGHYYGGTTLGTSPNSNIRVRLVENDGNDVIVTSASPFTAAGTAVPAGHAALMHLASAGSWTVSTGPGCAGPWTQVGTASDSQAMNNGAQGGASPTLAATTPPQAVATPSITSPTATRSQVLQLCQASAPLYVRGDIEGAEINGLERTVNVLPLESYLQGVVPSESPSYWGTLGSSGAQGQPQGFQALEAQAVAARSYALADEESPSSQGGTGEYGYADICDTTSCQVYGGMNAESSTSNLAVQDTAGQTLLTSGGQAAYAEFSSSTGGWTAGGGFPSVVDAGDSVCVPSACNPNHAWTATIPVSTIESAYPSIGTFQAVGVTSRSGPSAADMGGRVLQVSIQGSAGSVSVTGSTFASEFGLKSNWFAVTGAPSGGVDGYWAEGNDGGIFSFGDSQFYGSTGAMKLNKPVVGMAATPDGRGYWLVASDGGIFTFGDAAFHGSTGAIRLNQPIVGMAATPDGRGYWLVATDGGIFNFGDAAFYGSTGGTTLAASIVGMTTAGSGAGYWLLEADGTVHAFGSATAYGSPSLSSSNPAVGLAHTATYAGYLLATRNGSIYSFGDAPNYGGVGSQDPGYSGALLGLAIRAGS